MSQQKREEPCHTITVHTCIHGAHIHLCMNILAWEKAMEKNNVHMCNHRSCIHKVMSTHSRKAKMFSCPGMHTRKRLVFLSAYASHKNESGFRIQRINVCKMMMISAQRIHEAWGNTHGLTEYIRRSSSSERAAPATPDHSLPAKARA
jgi:hypothetical protein